MALLDDNGGRPSGASGVMMKSARAGTATTAMLIVLLSAAPAAHAYLDPSTGSMILSAIIGIFATVALAVKTWWYKLKSLFRRRDGGEPPGG